MTAKERLEKIKQVHEERIKQNELYTATFIHVNWLIEQVETKVNEGSFWEVCAKSKEEDVLVCLDYPMQNIVNNGDYTFMWEESWEHVELSGEFLGMRWKIREEE